MIAIAFTGQDGTGKSSQIELLRKALEERGLSVGVVHQYAPTTRLGNLILPLAKRLANRSARSTGSGSGSAVDRVGARRTPHPGAVRHIASVLSLSLGWARSRVNLFAHRTADVLILDRYFTDEIIRARHKFECGQRLGVWILRSGVPDPEIAITFSLDSRTGWERKKTRELTLDDYRRKVEIVGETLHSAEGIWDLVRIPVDGLGPAEVFAHVWGHVERLVAANL